MFQDSPRLGRKREGRKRGNELKEEEERNEAEREKKGKDGWKEERVKRKSNRLDLWGLLRTDPHHPPATKILHLPFVCRKTLKNRFNKRSDKMQKQMKTVKQDKNPNRFLLMLNH